MRVNDGIVTIAFCAGTQIPSFGIGFKRQERARPRLRDQPTSQLSPPAMAAVQPDATGSPAPKRMRSDYPTTTDPVPNPSQAWGELVDHEHKLDAHAEELLKVLGSMPAAGTDARGAYEEMMLTQLRQLLTSARLMVQEIREAAPSDGRTDSECLALVTSIKMVVSNSTAAMAALSPRAEDAVDDGCIRPPPPELHMCAEIVDGMARQFNATRLQYA